MNIARISVVLMTLCENTNFHIIITHAYPHTLPGVPGVKPERFAEGMEPKHCALSLVGEPIMYPEINTLARLLHQKGISTFLVTNAQFPEAIK